MKQLKSKLWVKITALLLLAVFAVGAVFCGIGTVLLTMENSYLDDGEALRHSINESILCSEIDDVVTFYEDAMEMKHHGDNGEYLSLFAERYDIRNTNLRVTIQELDGTILYSNDADPAIRYSCTETYPFSERNGTQYETMYFNSHEERDNYIAEKEAMGHICISTSGEEMIDPGSPTGRTLKVDIEWAEHTYRDVLVTLALPQEFSVNDEYKAINYWLELLLGMQDMIPLLTALFLILSLALFIFLLCAAGHVDGIEGIHLNWFNRIPFDLLTAAIVGICMLIVLFTYEVTFSVYHTENQILYIALCAVAGFWLVIFVMGLLMSFAARTKTGKWWHNTILWKISSFICRMVRNVWRCGTGLLRGLPGCWQLAAIVAGISLLELLLSLMADSEGVLLMSWILERPALIAMALLLHLSFRKIEAGGKALAEGDLHHQISTDMTVPPFRKHAEHLNHIGEGMQRAVDEQMKSERTKTELITNVSHDIKTPLTSIVNYVNLLKGLDIENDCAREYLDVLDRQSQRLRKLTEDLVEASKASAGSIPMEPERTDAELLLTQALGEYEDRFRELQLEPVTRLSAENAMIMADGKLLWRVFDNLLSNICKYSLPGTRVYLNTECRDGRVTVSFKNISRYALDISSDELMERFVRGDSSRSTEGSGLGLSIARSLTTLQGGTFHISIDGDLFRADISFPIV